MTWCPAARLSKRYSASRSTPDWTITSFSAKGRQQLFSDNNDGAVTLRRQLDLRARKDAAAKWGFDKRQVTTLSSQEMRVIYNDILERTGDGK